MKRIGWAAVFLQCAVFIQGVSGAVAQDAARSIEIHAKRFSFSPAEITLNEGETVKRVAMGQASAINQRWSMDFVAQRLADGRWIRVLTVVDQYTRECLTLHADTALSGEKVAAALDKVVALRGAPKSITVDNGTEFASKAMDHWAYLNGVYLDFIRPGRPVENGYIESFNGRLRDECLNVEVFFTLADARRKLVIWSDDYNQHRPHSALADRTPAEFAAMCSGGNDGDKTALKNAARLPHFPRTAAAGRDLTYASVSSHLLETIT